MDWQLLLVALIVVAALGIIMRRALRWMRPGAEKSSSCGTCSSCAASSSLPVVTLESFDRPAEP